MRTFDEWLTAETTWTPRAVPPIARAAWAVAVAENARHVRRLRGVIERLEDQNAELDEYINELETELGCLRRRLTAPSIPTILPTEPNNGIPTP